MSDPPVVIYASRSDVGMRRATNQDSLAVRLCSEYADWVRCGHLLVVADGMGGHAVGDLASRIAVESLPLAYFKVAADSVPDRLKKALTEANRAIYSKSSENPEFADMGTTCSVLSLSADGAYVGHVGDSRVYRVRQGQIEQLSFDHSLQWEMVRQGRATIDNVDQMHPRNVITRCLGPDQNVRIDIEGPFHVQQGDRFVLCSDGLTGHVTDTEIGSIVSHLPPGDAARLLINLANCRGGTDNVTALVVRIEKYPQLQGEFADRPTLTPATNNAGPAARSSKSGLASRAALLIFLVLGSAGLVLMSMGYLRTGLAMICPALIIGFIRMMVLSSRPEAPQFKQKPQTIKTDSGRIVPALHSPYRADTTGISPEFLEFLEEAQSELVTAARDNGWNVDFERLKQLHLHARNCVQQNQPEECLRVRAEAIDILMRELYLQMRHSTHARAGQAANPADSSVSS